MEDPRIERSKKYQLLDIITIAICAVICGADTWVYVAMFGRSREEWFRASPELPNGILSHDTFDDVFSRLDPDRFQECFMEWSRAVVELLPGEVVAIDGKTVRRSHDHSPQNMATLRQITHNQLKRETSLKVGILR